MSEVSEDKNKLGIILAVVAGLLALGMTFVFLKKMKDTAQGTVVQQVEYTTKNILVAARDLPAGHVLSVNNDLQAVSIPAGQDVEAFAQSCVAADNAKELEGRMLGTALAARGPLLYSNLADSYNLDKTFTEGYLKTVQLSRENLFGSHLSPGDHVDILATTQKKREQPPVPAIDPAKPDSQAALLSALMASMSNMDPANIEVDTKVILEDVEVFMIGSMLKLDRMQLGYLPQPDTGDLSEVTFRLDKKNALILTEYYNMPGAKISLLLRPRQKEKSAASGTE